MTDWIGDAGRLVKFSCRYRAVDYPRAMKTVSEPVDGEMWLCKGKVTKKYIDGDGEHCVDIETSATNQRGEDTMPGHSTVALPSREKGTWPVNIS